MENESVDTVVSMNGFHAFPVEDKVENTVIYVADYLTNEVDPNAVRLLMNAGFSTYRSLNFQK